MIIVINRALSILPRGALIKADHTENRFNVNRRFKGLRVRLSITNRCA